MLAREPKPIRGLLGREQFLLLGHSHRDPLASPSSLSISSVTSVA
jgi:hypothetical protein